MRWERSWDSCCWRPRRGSWRGKRACASSCASNANSRRPGRWW
jgi:hypothetical protein